VDVDAYLSRIGLKGDISASLADLERLQRAHLTAVPFENLDVFHHRGVQTGVEWSVPKIVEAGRGGWCYELNGAFAALLEELGFKVKRLGATVLPGEESTIPDHLAIEVELDRPYLVDVGFGDSFISPLPLDSEGPHNGGVGEFGFAFHSGDTTLLSHQADEATVPQYRFGQKPHVSSDFDQSSLRLQTEPGLQWTEGPFATRLLDGGPDRVTLLRSTLKFRRNGVWAEEAIAEAEWPKALAHWFKMTP